MDKKLYFKNLDSLRFFAFISVFISHLALFSGYTNNDYYYQQVQKLFLTHGDLGVNFFFVLSGFLITTLLFKEKEENGSIKIKDFYFRRILRIWPLYFFIFDIGFFLLPRLVGGVPGMIAEQGAFNISHFWWFLFFAGNVDMSFGVKPFISVAILWSISAEEQFYFIWPWIVKKFQKKGILTVSILTIVISYIFRIFVVKEDLSLFNFFTISLMSDFAVGTLLAYILLFRSVRERLSRLPQKVIILVYVLLIILLPTKSILSNFLSGFTFKVFFALLPLIFSILFAFIIAEQEFATRSFFKAGNWKWFTFLGRRSYGLYCLHIICLIISQTVMYYFFHIPLYHSSGQIYILESIFAFALTVASSTLSYRLLEEPFLRLKTSFSGKTDARLGK